MATREADHILRKKLQTFLKQILHVGTLKAFKHFSLYIRGKEELLVTVVNEPVSCGPSSLSHAVSPGSTVKTGTQKEQIAPGNSLCSGNLPYDTNSLLLSQTTQMKLSGYEDEGIGLPPASPSDDEITNNDSGTTLFLLACYSRYGCPYVWVRSNHDRLLRLSRDNQTKDKDNPLKLKTTSSWRKQEYHISEILAEIVKLCAYPPPQNPLAIDFTELANLTPINRLMTSGALLQFLEAIIMSTDDNKYYVSHVLEDHQQLITLHMKTLKEMMRTGSISVTQQSTQRGAPVVAR